MSNWFRYIVSLAFLMHGLGMAGGVYFVFAQPGWLLKTLGGGLMVKIAVGLLWVVSGVAFLTAAWGLFQNTAWWTSAAWIAAPLSLVGILLWAGAVPPGTYVGAGLAVAVIAYLLLARP